MRLLKKECGKLIKHPLPWCMTGLFLALNLLLLYGDIGGRDARLHFHRLHDTILDYGLDLDHPNPAFDASGDMAQFYLSYVEYQGNLYDGLDMLSLLEHKKAVTNYRPAGAYAGFLRHNYEKLQRRVEEIRSTGEGRYGFYPGGASKIHSLLYATTMRRLLLENALLMMLSVLYLMDYERLCKTRAITFATRTGKALMTRKISAGIGTGLLFGALLTAGTMGMIFYQIPFQGLWDVPVSTAMLAEARLYGFYPFVSFWPLTQGSYLFLTLAVMVLLLTVAGCLTAAVQLLLQNSYFVFLLNAMLYPALFLASSGWFCNFADIFICLNPAGLWILCGCWFIEHELIASFAGSEFLCLGIWSAIAAAGLFTGRLRFLRLELK